MKILIVGGEQIGGTIAEYLASEGNDVTVVDLNSKKLDSLRDRLDINTIAGNACHPHVLRQAGIIDTDILIAATLQDEMNMIVCQMAYSLFKTPQKIACIRSEGLTEKNVRNYLFTSSHVPVDVVITPEQLVTEYIERLVKQPGALQILDFADGLIKLVAMKAGPEAPLVGKELRVLKEHIAANIECRVAAIYRNDVAIMPDSKTIVEVDDEVFFLADSRHIRKVMSEMAHLEKPDKRIIIVGGGNIGLRLARSLEYDYKVKVIEYNQERCELLAEQLNSTIVLNGEGSDQKLLLEEDIANTHVFIAVTNNDAANIISSMLAKRLGAGKVITIINNPAYAELMEADVIDIAVSPQQITTSALLSHVRRGDTIRAYPLRRNAAEAVEMVVHGDSSTSKLVGKRLRDLNLPEGVGIGAIKRGPPANPLILMGRKDLIIEDNDHVVVFTIDRTKLKEIELLFQVNMSFF